MHRPSLSGVEHLPASGPYLLVANHSAGMAVSEVFSFAALWLEQLGPGRPLAGFAHPFGFRLLPFRAVLRHLGAIPSTYAAAESTLAAGVPVLVFPGGDHESLRPIWKAHRVDFAGRKGFLRIARKLRVPIVPMGIHGSHFTAPILWRSRALAWFLVSPRVVGLKRFGLTVLGVAAALAVWFGASWDWPWRALVAWVLLASPIPFFPWIPATIRFRIGQPIAPAELFPADHDEDGDLDEALARIQSEVQRLVDAEARG
jgi:1-acyl-sn-glycerol-3-phosphate acyltransferase